MSTSKRESTLWVPVVFSMLFLSSTQFASANIPPPQKFVQHEGAFGKASPARVVFADDREQRGEETHDSGSAYQTSKFCAIVLDVIATSSTRGVLRIKGSSSDSLGVPSFDEVTPLTLDGSHAEQTLVVPLRHYYTDFIWEPQSGEQHGPITVYGTPIPCGAGIMRDGN